MHWKEQKLNQLFGSMPETRAGLKDAIAWTLAELARVRAELADIRARENATHWFWVPSMDPGEVPDDAASPDDWRRFIEEMT